MKSIIRNFVAKMVAGRSDDGIMITLSDPRKVDFQAAMLEDLLMRNGIDPRAITSEAQLKIILNQIETASKQTTPSGIRNAESAKVFDLEGKEIPKGSKIMGGKAIDDDLPPPGSRGGDEDIAAPVQSQEETLRNMTEAEIKANLEAQNKSAVENILKRKNREDVYGIEDYDTTNMSEIKKEIIRTETKLGNLNPNNPDFRERAKPLIDKITALQKKLREDKADGGRIGLKGGADASQFDKSPSEQRSVDISPSGSVTLGSGPPEGPDDRGSDTQNAVQAMVRAGFTPKEINAITNPTVFDKVKQSRFNNPLTRGILRTGAYLYNPSLAGIDFRRAMQAKDLYDYTMNQINNPQITEEDMQFAKGGRAGFKGGTGITDRLVSLLGGKNMAAAELGLEGLNQIYQLLQMPGLYAKGGRAGFFMGSTLPKGLATLRQMLNYMGNKSDKVQYPSDVLKMVNPKSLNKMLEDPRLQGKVNIKEGIMASDMVKNFQSKMGEDRVQLVRDMLDSAKNIKRTDDKILAYKNEIKERMMKELNMSEAEADRAATAMSRLAMDITKMPNTPKLTDEGILELENVLKNMETGGKKKRDLNADGGRIGLKDGMNRRTFLKLLGGLAAIPIVGKIIKPLKTVKGVKNVPIIKTDAVPGKPEWFDQLVNKVIIEGEDVTKKLATVEREIVHTKKINNTDEVTVYQDLNTNSVRVEYKSPDNMMEEPVDLSYKRTPPDEGAPRGDVDFEATEMGYVGRADGPDDYFIDAEEVGGRSIKDLDSDVSALKEYATGQKPTIKEILQKKKRKDKVKKLNEGDLEAQSDYITARQGDAYDYDDYASGGIARMLGE